MGIRRISTNNSSSSNFTDTGSIDKSLLNILSRRELLKTIEDPLRIKTEVDLFFQNAIIKTDNGEVSEDFDLLDEYLGTLGLDT